MGRKNIARRRDPKKYDIDISYVVIVLYVSKYSSLGTRRFLLIKNEEYYNKELSGMGFCSNCDPFSCPCNNDGDDDSETTELALMGESESKHSKEKIDSKFIPLEGEDQGKLEIMDNENVPMLRKDNYQQWKEKMKYNLMYLDVWYLVCNDYTKTPPSNKEVKKNSKALSDIFCSIRDSTLKGYALYHCKESVG